MARGPMGKLLRSGVPSVAGARARAISRGVGGGWRPGDSPEIEADRRRLTERSELEARPVAWLVSQ